MKKLIVLGWIVLMLASVAWTQEKLEAPVWNVGDKWAYKSATGGTWTSEIVEIKEGLLIEKRQGSKELYAYDATTLNLKSMINESGRQSKPTWVLRKLFDFPIFVGKTWSDTTYSTPARSQNEVTYIHDFKVEGIEEVSTAAGTFKAYKIHYKQTNLSSHNNGWIIFWYSPDVKNWMKREVENVTYWQGSYQTAELTSHKVK